MEASIGIVVSEGDLVVTLLHTAPALVWLSQVYVVFLIPIELLDG